MFTLYVQSSVGISVHWFPTQKECEKYIQSISVSNYKILPSDKQKNLYFFKSLKWDEQKQDFVIDINKAKEQKLNEFRMDRGRYFDKLDKILFKAIEKDDLQTKEKVFSLKEQLRDVTELVLPNTEAELIVYRPQVFLEIDSLII
jgi:hypothetical protein